MQLKPINGRIITVFALTLFAAAAQSGQPAPERAKYVPAQAIRKTAPRYPQKAAEGLRDGWVLLSYIVSTSGNVKDVMIEDSTGNEDLERAAVRAAKNWSYKPATLNGKPVEQSMVHTLVTFRLEVRKGARRSFISSFARAQSAIRAGKLDEAEKMLDAPELTDRENLYEDAWFWWLKYEYLFTAGHSSPDQLMDCLQKAIGYLNSDVPNSKEDQNYLPPDVFVGAAERLFVLQAQTLDLSGAIRTFDRLSSSRSARRGHRYSEVMKKLKPAYAQIKSLISGDRTLEMDARVGEFGDWVHELVRRSFSLGKIKGNLAALEVRCKRGTKTFAVSNTSGNRHSIPDSWGDCSVYVKGDEGATFALYQYPEKRG